MLNISFLLTCLHNWISSSVLTSLHSVLNVHPAVFPESKPQSRSIWKVNAVSSCDTLKRLPNLNIPTYYVLSLESKTDQVFVNARSKAEKVGTGKGNQYWIPLPRIVILELHSTVELPGSFKNSHYPAFTPFQLHHNLHGCDPSISMSISC